MMRIFSCENIIGFRDYIVKILYDAGTEPLIPEGEYFMIDDWTPLSPVE
jgi:hypothetical protein